MNESFPAVTGDIDIFNDNLHSFSISCNILLHLSLIIICSSEETTFLKIRSGRLSVFRYRNWYRTNITPVEGYYTNIRVYRKAQLG